jgi:hypothetical protein
MLREVPPPPDGPPEFEQLAAIGERNGMQVQPMPEG